jgi:predicted  nucleic acid-binding Zn-ribbon protein
MKVKTMTKRDHKLLLHACPRCQGDLFPDLEDEDLLACLQCGRRYPEAQLSVEAESTRELIAAA